jgi:hypothetical protein
MACAFVAAPHDDPAVFAERIDVTPDLGANGSTHEMAEAMVVAVGGRA